MAKTRKTNRRNCQLPDPSISLTVPSPRQALTVVDTPRRARLICDAQATAGKLPRKALFKAHGVAEATGYRIIKSNSMRRSERIRNRGRKPILAPYQCDAIEAVEDSSFRYAATSHYAIARAIGLGEGSERAIQRNMHNHGVGTYMAQQKKFILKSSMEKRGLWGFERRYWQLDDFKRYKYSDESHFACALQRQARIHRRRGKQHRDAPTKIQFRFKRRNQVWHVFAYIGWDYKSSLHFYEGTGAKGRLVQADYMVFLEKIIAPN
jgi:hypothetical protein